MSLSGSHPTRDEGLRLIKEGNYDEAIRILDMVVETDPSDAQALLYLGVAYAESGKKAESIAALEQCVGVKPSARANYNLGLAYESVDRLGEAMTQYENAVRLDPNYKSAVDSVERLKQKGIQARESEVQWTIGAQSVGDMLAQQKTQQMASPTDQTTSVPPAYTPGSLQANMQGPSRTGPGPYLPGQYEAQKEAELRKHQMQMLKSGLIYGALIGAGIQLILTICFAFFGTFMLVFILGRMLAGAFVGAIIGAAAGYTGGGEETGARVGAVLFFILVVVSGLIEHVSLLFVIVPALINGLIGWFVGMYIGKLVAQSIGWD